MLIVLKSNALHLRPTRVLDGRLPGTAVSADSVSGQAPAEKPSISYESVSREGGSGGQKHDIGSVNLQSASQYRAQNRTAANKMET